jgi:hypothetical protein
MSPIQRFFTAILPQRWAEAMEAESRAWILTCPCGEETSIWQAGGIRFKATGNPTRLHRCPNCGLTLHHLEKREPATHP